MSSWSAGVCSATCECSGLGHSAVLVLRGDDAGSGAEHRRGQQGQLFYDTADAWVVLRQLAEALLQRMPQEVELLTRFVKTSLGLKLRWKSMKCLETLPLLKLLPWITPNIHLWMCSFFCDFSWAQQFHDVFGSLGDGGLYLGVVTQLLHP